MILTRSVALNNARAGVHASLLAGGAVLLYDGAMPAAGAPVTQQVLLARLAIPTPSGTVDGGVFSLSVPIDAMVMDDGAPGWARIVAADDAWLMDMDVGGTGSGAAIIISPAMLYAGGTVRIERLRLIEP